MLGPAHSIQSFDLSTASSRIIQQHTVIGGILYDKYSSRSMKIATLQFDPKIGQVKNNIALAESLLETTDLKGVQLLVGPELALTGKSISYKSNEVF